MEMETKSESKTIGNFHGNYHDFGNSMLKFRQLEKFASYISNFRGDKSRFDKNCSVFE